MRAPSVPSIVSARPPPLTLGRICSRGRERERVRELKQQELITLMLPAQVICCLQQAPKSDK